MIRVFGRSGRFGAVGGVGGGAHSRGCGFLPVLCPHDLVAIRKWWQAFFIDGFPDDIVDPGRIALIHEVRAVSDDGKIQTPVHFSTQHLRSLHNVISDGTWNIVVTEGLAWAGFGGAKGYAQSPGLREREIEKQLI
ncbi:hypothetical protein B0H14DRAFT_2561825 [Mycena olivaceomarginata]|nr:hypothetical protein B0H14DRAFT_2561825 [Mycena olivaceomarginata]